MIISIDYKLISVCLINDYSLIVDLDIFVYGRAEFSSIPLEYTKVILLILNNFGLNRKKCHLLQPKIDPFKLLSHIT